MTNDELVALAKPICDAVGVDSVSAVMSIVMTPTEVYVEYQEHGKRHIVSVPVTRGTDA